MAARNIKKNSLSYKHFTEGLRTATLDPQILCVSGPSTYLKLKVEEWYNKKSPSENQVVKLLAEAVSTSDLDDMLYQDSIFEPSSYYIIRKCDRQSEIAQALRKIQDAKQIKNTILLVSQNRSFGANIQKELTRLQMKTIPCFEPNLYELPKFILSLAKRHQLNIDQSGAGAILEALGTDLPLIENELKGLSLIFADREGELITRDDLSPYLDCLKAEHAFKIDQSLIDGKFAQAQALLHDLLRRGESHLAILGILSHHCRKALQIYYLSKEGRSIQEISRSAGLPFSVVKAFQPYLRQASPKRFKSALSQCQEADIIFKTSKVQSELVLSQIINSLALG